MQARHHEGAAKASFELCDAAQTTVLCARVLAKGFVGLEAQVRRFYKERASMTKDEALKLALEALKRTGNIAGFAHEREQAAITAIRETLTQPEQEPVAYIDVEQRRLQWAKPMSWNTPTTVNLPKIPLYTAPPQPEERNFCLRCGKRTADLTTIHTCTPPRNAA